MGQSDRRTSQKSTHDPEFFDFQAKMDFPFDLGMQTVDQPDIRRRREERKAAVIDCLYSER
jgi:hypothetical protein